KVTLAHADRNIPVAGCLGDPDDFARRSEIPARGLRQGGLGFRRARKDTREHAEGNAFGARLQERPPTALGRRQPTLLCPVSHAMPSLGCCHAAPTRRPTTSSPAAARITTPATIPSQNWVTPIKIRPLVNIVRITRPIKLPKTVPRPPNNPTPPMIT